MPFPHGCVWEVLASLLVRELRLEQRHSVLGIFGRNSHSGMEPWPQVIYSGALILILRLSSSFTSFCTWWWRMSSQLPSHPEGRYCLNVYSKENITEKRGTLCAPGCSCFWSQNSPTAQFCKPGIFCFDYTSLCCIFFHWWLKNYQKTCWIIRRNLTIREGLW